MSRTVPFWRIPATVVVLLACSLSTVAADETSAPDADESLGTLSLVIENDFFARTDQKYTNGFRLQYLRPKGQVSDLTGWLAGMTLGEQNESLLYEGVSLGQSLFTPLDITDPNPRPGEQPYAGWLYLEFAAILADRNDAGELNRVDTVSATAGIVGPLAGGEFVQNTFHQLIDSEIAQGWSNQLDNEPGLLLSYDRTWMKARSLREHGFDVLPSVGISVGNILTEARGGFTLRFGPDLDESLGPPRIRPSLAGAGYLGNSNAFNWYVFAGLQGRAVARNIFLDGNTFSGSLRVKKRHLVADAQAGLVVSYGGLRFSYTLVRRSREFATQQDPHYFAAFSLTARY